MTADSVPPLFTTSWDDGDPHDLRVAELLAKYGLTGTFYVPISNREGRAVLPASALRTLAASFEVGSHTRTHRYLRGQPAASARAEIESGKTQLEDLLGQRVTGFCYPGGKHDASIRRAVQSAGFGYARTVECFRVDLDWDVLRMPTTLQLHSSRRLALGRNFLRQGAWLRRAPTFVPAICAHELDARLDRLLQGVSPRGGMLHVWGHSWELEAYNLWSSLERFLASAAALFPPLARVTNHELAVRRRAVSG